MHQWHQSKLSLPPFPRGCHLITHLVEAAMPRLQDCRIGLLHVFIRHTSAGLSINENADPDVLADLQMALDRLAPESLPYRHTSDGSDDMPAHVKTTLIGCSVSVPVSAGQLLTGTWQGIYLCEQRNQAGRRQLVLTLNGDFTD